MTTMPATNSHDNSTASCNSVATEMFCRRKLNTSAPAPAKRVHARPPSDRRFHAVHPPLLCAQLALLFLFRAYGCARGAWTVVEATAVVQATYSDHNSGRRFHAHRTASLRATRYTPLFPLSRSAEGDGGTNFALAKNRADKRPRPAAGQPDRFSSCKSFLAAV